MQLYSDLDVPELYPYTATPAAKTIIKGSMMRSIIVRSILWILAFACVPNLYAHDLVLQDIKSIKVSPCDRQIRLSVRLDAVGHKHLAGKSATGLYRIEVFSQDRKKILYELSVTDHDPGETLFFVVPSQKLACDTNVKISVDADNVVLETNEKNNSHLQGLSRPKSSGLIEACATEADKCP